MNNNITCVIIDDEQDAIELLAQRINHLHKKITIVNSYTFWEDALEGLRGFAPDLIFVDISMPEKGGMDLLQLLPDLKSEIIFVTSYADYALDAFKFAATGYILKPVNDLALNKAINKAVERIENKTSSNENVNLNSEIIGISNNQGIDYIPIKDIIYFETIQRLTNIICVNSKLFSSYNIGKFREMVKGKGFYQVHRSYVINLHFIKRYERTGIVIMSNNAQIPVSKHIREDFLKLFDQATN